MNGDQKVGWIGLNLHFYLHYCFVSDLFSEIGGYAFSKMLNLLFQPLINFSIDLGVQTS